MGTAPYTPAPSRGRYLTDGCFLPDLFATGPNSQQICDKMRKEIPQLQHLHDHFNAAIASLESLYRDGYEDAGTASLSTAGSRSPASFQTTNPTRTPAGLMLDFFHENSTGYLAYNNDLEMVMRALQNPRVSPTRPETQTGIMFPALNDFLEELSPAQLTDHSNWTTDHVLTPESFALIKAGVENLEKLYMVLRKIHTMPQQREWIHGASPGPVGNEKPHPLTRAELIEQFCKILRQLNSQITNNRSPGPRKRYLERAVTQSLQLLAADGLQRMLQQHFCKILLNLTTKLTESGDGNPAVSGLKRHLEEYDEYLFGQERWTFLDNLEYTRQWFCEIPASERQKAIDALLEVAQERFKVPLTLNINPGDRKLQTLKFYSHRWARAIYREYLNTEMNSRTGTLNPVCFIESIASDIVDGRSFSIIDDKRAAHHYFRIPDLLEVLGVQVNRLKAGCIIERDSEGRIQWAPNAKADLAAHLLLGAIAERFIKPQMVVGINEQQEFVFRGMSMEPAEARSVLQNCSAGRIVFIPLSLYGQQRQEVRFEFANAPANSQRKIDHFMANFAALTDREPDLTQLPSILQFMTQLDNDVSRTAIAYGPINAKGVLQPLQEALEWEFTRPSYSDDNQLQQAWNTLTLPGNQYLLRALLRASSNSGWENRAIGRLFNQILHRRDENPDRSPVKPLLMNVLKDRKTARAGRFPSFKLDVDALLASHNINLLKELLEQGLLNPDVRADNISLSKISDKSLLVYAIKHGSPQSVQLLCEMGALARDASWFAGDSIKSQQLMLKSAFDKHGRQFGYSDFAARCIDTWSRVAPVKLEREIAAAKERAIEQKRYEEAARIRRLDREPLM